MTGRRWRAALAATVLVVVAAGCQVVPSIRYDQGNSGYNKSDTTLTPADVTAMKTQYTAALGNLGTNAANVSIYPVWADGRVFVPTVGAVRGFDDAGVDGCSGTPTTCVPTWSGDFGAPWYSYGGAEVDGSRVFVEASDGNASGQLLAFDTADGTGCTGTPKTCPPQWTAAVLNFGTPTVAEGRVYAFDMATHAVKVFDAAGVTGCSGTPKVCQPLWTAPTSDVELPPTRLAVVDGSVYALSRHGTLTVSDATGVDGCSGTPVVCQPRWTAPPGAAWASAGYGYAPPVVAEGKVFFMRARNPSGDPYAADVFAYDAAGATNCSGTPTTCQPVWSMPAGQAGWNPLSVAEGRVYVSDRTARATRVYDASGAGCTGSPTPTNCPVLFTLAGISGMTITHGLALVANGTSFAASDATGAGCSSVPCAASALITLKKGFSAGFVYGDHKLFGVSVTSTGDATLEAVW